MRHAKIFFIQGLLILFALICCGCSSQFTEWDYKSVSELRVIALNYKKALIVQKRHQEALRDAINRIIPEGTPATPELMEKLEKSEEFQQLYQQMDKECSSLPIDCISANWETFDLIRQKIKQKGGSLSGLELDDEDSYRYQNEIYIPPPLQREPLMPPNAPYTERGVTP